MTGEELERAIEFLLDQDAKLSAKIADLVKSIAEMKVIHQQQNERMEAQSRRLGEQSRRLEEHGNRFEIVTTEMREGFNNLTIANETTRKLAEEVRLALHTSQRVSVMESKL